MLLASGNNEVLNEKISFLNRMYPINRPVSLIIFTACDHVIFFFPSVMVIGKGRRRLYPLRLPFPPPHTERDSFPSFRVPSSFLIFIFQFAFNFSLKPRIFIHIFLPRCERSSLEWIMLWHSLWTVARLLTLLTRDIGKCGWIWWTSTLSITCSPHILHFPLSRLNAYGRLRKYSKLYIIGKVPVRIRIARSEFITSSSARCLGDMRRLLATLRRFCLPPNMVTPEGL